jgi:hypothetical protein
LSRQSERRDSFVRKNRVQVQHDWLTIRHCA